jgi:hypothetical protein
MTHTIEKIDSYQSRDSNDRTKIIMHALLKYAPGDRPRATFSREVDSCADDDKLHELGQHYFHNLLVPCKYMTNPRLSFLSWAASSSGGG